MAERYGDEEISQFRGAQPIAEKWGFSREDLEHFRWRLTGGRFVRSTSPFVEEIAPIAGVNTGEGARRDASMEAMAQLKPLREGWTLTAAMASQMSFGAAALLVASERAVHTHNLTPIARVHALAVVGDDPVYMLTGPIPATAAVLARSGLNIDDIDVFEVNEAFAAIPMAWADETGASLDKTNVNGGADRAWTPAWSHRRHPGHEAHIRAAPLRRPLRVADDVRGRWPGQTPPSSSASDAATWAVDPLITQHSSHHQRTGGHRS
jgi:acetyl-CoA C-acetyltransferase